MTEFAQKTLSNSKQDIYKDNIDENIHIDNIKSHP